MHPRPFLFLLVLFCLLSTSAATTPLFGNLKIELDKAANAPSTSVEIHVNGQTVQHTFAKGQFVVLWNIRTGSQPIELIIDGVTLVDTVEISPNLTSRLLLTHGESGWTLSSNGFADLTGAVIGFSSTELAGLPGELNDALGPYTLSVDGSVGYDWNGMSLQSSSNGRRMSLANKTTPQSALVNLTDPFAGNGDSVVSLTPVTGVNFDARFQSLYGTRDQRITNGSLQLPLPDQLGMLNAAISYENSADATPRSNIDYRLPHNDLDNVELTAGLRMGLGSRLTSETSLLYRTYERNIYLHEFYFDVPHMPREEGNLYNARTMLYGWLNPTLFLEGSFNIHGDGLTVGDGKLPDDVRSYAQFSNNYRQDEFGLFYDGDFPPVYDDNDSCLYGCGDDAHFYDDYQRYRTNGFGAELSFTKILNGQTKLALGASMQRETYRYYHNSTPSSFDTAYHQWANIGYDIYGAETIDEWTFAMPATPTFYGLKLSAQHLGTPFFARLELNAKIFDPHALTFRSLTNPLDPGNISYQPSELDGSDMEEVGAKLYTERKLGFGVHLGDKATIFGRLSRTADFPDYNLLYGDLHYLITLLWSGHPYTFENPTLKPVWTDDLGVGMQAEVGAFDLTIDYQHRRVEGMIQSYYVSSAYPTSFEQWRNVEVASDPEEDRLTGVIRTNRPGPFGGQLALSYFSRNERWPDSMMYIVVWAGNISFKAITRYAASGSCHFDLGELEAGSVPSILSRLRFDLQATARSGVRFTPIRVDNEINLSGYSPQPMGQAQSSKARDFLEINVGLTARIIRSANQSFAVRLEVINLLDRENWERVYSGTGLPDNTRWLTTDEGLVWSDYHQTPDITGYNGPEKYLLRQNDPNNFGRPRIIRILAQFSF
jgi:hypothetical protein